MVAMDTKFGRIYCAISYFRNLLYFQLQLPQNFTYRNETYGIIKSWWSLQKYVLDFQNFAPKSFFNIF